MKLFTWLGMAIATCGTVLMLFWERLAGFSTDRVSSLQPGWFDHVHWYLLVGVFVTLGGDLTAPGKLYFAAPTRIAPSNKKWLCQRELAELEYKQNKSKAAVGSRARYVAKVSRPQCRQNSKPCSTSG